MLPQAPKIVDICIAEGVRAVSYSRSPDAKTIERFKSAGILCIPTVGALKHAVKAVELGADALVVQEAKGVVIPGVSHLNITAAGERGGHSATGSSRRFRDGRA